jgi:hypothetical protein
MLVIRVQHSLTINEPVETVFAALMDFEIEMQGPGFFKLIEPLIKPGLSKDVVTRFATLKSMLETNHHL